MIYDNNHVLWLEQSLTKWTYNVARRQKLKWTTDTLQEFFYSLKPISYTPFPKRYRKMKRKNEVTVIHFFSFGGTIEELTILSILRRHESQISWQDLLGHTTILQGTTSSSTSQTKTKTRRRRYESSRPKSNWITSTKQNISPRTEPSDYVLTAKH